MKVKITAEEVSPVYSVETWEQWRKRYHLKSKSKDFPDDVYGVQEMPDYIVAEIQKIEAKYERLQDWLSNYRNTEVYHRNFGYI